MRLFSGGSLDFRADVPVSVQSRIEQERRDCRLIWLLALAILEVALILRRCEQPVNIHDPRFIDQVKSNWADALTTWSNRTGGQMQPMADPQSEKPE